MNQELKTLIFLGPQGSGKGTQARLLAERFGYQTYSTGEILRNISKEDSSLGLQVKQTIDAGHLVQPELISEVVLETLCSVPTDEKVIIDGYPRSLAQYELMKQNFPKVGRGRYITVYFDITEDETMQRLQSRAEKEGRADDNEQAIKMRLAHYREETLPMIELMKKESNYIHIDGMPGIEEIHQDVVNKLGLL